MRIINLCGRIYDGPSYMSTAESYAFCGKGDTAAVIKLRILKNMGSFYEFPCHTCAGAILISV